jgi:hypothetical protein
VTPCGGGRQSGCLCAISLGGGPNRNISESAKLWGKQPQKSEKWQISPHTIFKMPSNAALHKFGASQLQNFGAPTHNEAEYGRCISLGPRRSQNFVSPHIKKIIYGSPLSRIPLFLCARIALSVCTGHPHIRPRVRVVSTSKPPENMVRISPEYCGNSVQLVPIIHCQFC